jgi:PmbA protein
MDIMKELCKKAEQVEIISLQNETTTVSFEANQLKSSKVAETRGMAVRVVRDGRLGFAASSDEKAITKLAANVLESAAYGDRLAIHFPALQPAPRVNSYDQKIVDLSIPRLVEMGREILDLILPVEPEARVNLNITKSVQSSNLKNHTGLDIAFERSPLNFELEIDRIVGDDVLIIFDLAGMTLWNDDYLNFARRLVEQLKMARNLTSMKGGSAGAGFAIE